jgi:hypothetical protein
MLERTQHRINKNILKIKEFNLESQKFLDGLPTFFRAARAMVRTIKRISNETNRPPNWKSFPVFATFESANQKQTKRNLRIALRHEAKEKKAFLFGKNFCTSTVYKNPIVQNFFEFSLFYSWVKNIKLPASKAKTIYIDVCQVSLGKDIKNKKKTEIFNEFLLFIQGDVGIFKPDNLSDYKGGNTQKPRTRKILELHDKGRNNSQIARQMTEGKLLEFTRTRISQGFNENQARDLAKKDYEDELKAEMKRVATTIRNSKDKKTEN